MGTYLVEGTTAVKFMAYVEAESPEAAQASAVGEVIAPNPDNDEVVFDIIYNSGTEFTKTTRVDGDFLYE